MTVVMRIYVPLLPVRALNDGGHAHFMCPCSQCVLSMTVVTRICVPLLPVRVLNDGGHAHLCALAPSARSQ